jgi:hypothetical protein
LRTQLETLQAAVTTAATEFGREQRPPEAPFAYGSDLDCITDVRPTWAELDPESPKGIAQAVVRRWLLPRSDLLLVGETDQGDYGLGLNGWLNRGTSARDLQVLAGRMNIEARQDDRVQDCTVSLSVDLRAKLLGIKAHITPVDPELGEFQLTFALTSDATPLLAESGTLPFPPVDFGLQAALVVDNFGDEVIDGGGSLVTI